MPHKRSRGGGTLSAMVAILVLLAVAGGWYLYQNTPPIGEAPVAKPTPEVKAADVAAPTNDVETLSDEQKAQRDVELSFYEVLRDEAVDVDKIQVTDRDSTTTARPADNRKWLVQAGSFRNQRDADRMRANLLLNGLTETKVDEIDVDSGRWYRVVVGPVDHRSQANAIKDRLVELDIQPLTRRVP